MYIHTNHVEMDISKQRERERERLLLLLLLKPLSVAAEKVVRGHEFCSMYDLYILSVEACQHMDRHITLK